MSHTNPKNKVVLSTESNDPNKQKKQASALGHWFTLGKVYSRHDFIKTRSK